jgi:hypothetical protein
MYSSIPPSARVAQIDIEKQLLEVGTLAGRVGFELAVVEARHSSLS